MHTKLLKCTILTIYYTTVWTKKKNTCRMKKQVMNDYLKNGLNVKFLMFTWRCQWIMSRLNSANCFPVSLFHQAMLLLTSVHWLLKLEACVQKTYFTLICNKNNHMARKITLWNDFNFLYKPVQLALIKALWMWQSTTLFYIMT